MIKMFLSCKEATQICNKSQYSESSVWERLKLHIHILFCSLCKAQTIKNQKLTETIKKSNIVYLDAQTKMSFKESLQKEMDKGNF